MKTKRVFNYSGAIVAGLVFGWVLDYGIIVVGASTFGGWYLGGLLNAKIGN